MNDVVKLDLYVYTRTKYKLGSKDTLFLFKHKYFVVFWTKSFMLLKSTKSL